MLPAFRLAALLAPLAEPRLAVDRLEDALRERPDALRDEAPRADADFPLPLDRLLFDLLLPALRDVLLPDFPRDFLALVAIHASPRRQ